MWQPLRNESRELRRSSDAMGAVHALDVFSGSKSADGSMLRLQEGGAAGAESAVSGAGGSSRVSRSASSRRQQAVLETATRLMAASDSD
jgi:hypothetical protein